MARDSVFATIFRVSKAAVTNQIASMSPRLYVRLTGETGRGLGAESAGQAADYFRQCFVDYFRVLGVAVAEIEDYLRDKRVLEYGPGDVPGVAMLMVAYGARQVVCVDRFPLLQLSEKNVHVLEDLLEGLDPVKRARARQCFVDSSRVDSGFDAKHIDYRINSRGLSGLMGNVDLVYSRAVLEHVNDLRATVEDMTAAMRVGASAIHQVDLKSHGLHRHNRLDFLTWSSFLWHLMFSNKGVPNRLRVDQYRANVAHSGLELVLLEPTTLADDGEVVEIRPHLAKQFREISDQDLRCLGFWLVCRKKKDQ